MFVKIGYILLNHFVAGLISFKYLDLNTKSKMVHGPPFSLAPAPQILEEGLHWFIQMYPFFYMNGHNLHISFLIKI